MSRCCSRAGSSGGPNQKSISAVARSGRVEAGRIRRSPGGWDICELLAKIELRVPGWVVFKRSKHLVSELFVKGACLKARGFQRCGKTASFDRVFFGGPEQPRPIAAMTHRRGHPKMRHVQPTAPNI